MLCKISNDFLLVNGPDDSLCVLSTVDLSVAKDLSTDGEMAFCAVKVNQYLYVGCNKGLVFLFNTERDWERTGPVQLSSKKISQMRIVVEDDAACTKNVLCC